MRLYPYLFLLALLLVLPVFAYAQERIVSFDTFLEIYPDATLEVEERIVYDFGVAERHGIYRTIPTTYKASDGKRRIDIEEVRVFDEYGTPYTTSLSKGGGTLTIRIGDADRLISGVHTYFITYTVDGAVGYFENFDEIYWNTTGNDWNVPIGQARAMIVPPEGVAERDARIVCYYGILGAVDTCEYDVYGVGGNVASVSFVPPRSLGAHEGLTVALGFPKGFVYEPTAFERALSGAHTAWPLALPLIVFTFLFYRWRRNGDDPAGRGVIVPQYDVPEGLTPMEVDGILNQGIGGKAIAGELIHLAVKGYISIRRFKEKVLFFEMPDYELLLIRDIDDALPMHEQGLLRSLFGSKKHVTLFSLRKDKSKARVLYALLHDIKKELFNTLIDRGFYRNNPHKVKALYGGSGMTILFIGLFLIPPFANFVLSFAIILSGILCMIFSFVMPSKTEKGIAARDYILGLKDYLQIAEKDRLAFHHAPEKNPVLFEKLLPYAIVLGVDEVWAKEFEDIGMSPPHWYNDTTGSVFSTGAFISDLGTFTTTAGSFGSSSGGSGGGGSSGGGGGGGGGGSW